MLSSILVAISILSLLTEGVQARPKEDPFKFLTPPTFRPINSTALEVTFKLPEEIVEEYMEIKLTHDKQEIGRAAEISEAVIVADIDPCKNYPHLQVIVNTSSHEDQFYSEYFDYNSFHHCNNGTIIQPKRDILEDNLILVCVIGGLVILLLLLLITVLLLKLQRKKPEDGAPGDMDQNPEYGDSNSSGYGTTTEIYDKNVDYYGVEDSSYIP